MSNKITLNVTQSKDLIRSLRSIADHLSDIQQLSNEDKDKFLDNLLNAAKADIHNLVKDIAPSK